MAVFLSLSHETERVLTWLKASRNIGREWAYNTVWELRAFLCQL